MFVYVVFISLLVGFSAIPLALSCSVPVDQRAGLKGLVLRDVSKDQGT